MLMDEFDVMLVSEHRHLHQPPRDEGRDRPANTLSSIPSPAAFLNANQQQSSQQQRLLAFGTPPLPSAFHSSNNAAGGSGNSHQQLTSPALARTLGGPQQYAGWKVGLAAPIPKEPNPAHEATREDREISPMMGYASLISASALTNDGSAGANTGAALRGGSLDNDMSCDATKPALALQGQSVENTAKFATEKNTRVRLQQHLQPQPFKPTVVSQQQPHASGAAVAPTSDTSSARCYSSPNGSHQPSPTKRRVRRSMSSAFSDISQTSTQAARGVAS